MRILKGAEISAALKEEIRAEMQGMERAPRLAVMRAGENPEDIAYENGAVRRLSGLGMEIVKYTCPADVEAEKFRQEFDALNRDPSVDGILLLRPLPPQLSEEELAERINPDKDVDGISPINMARVFCGREDGFAPCTAEAVVKMLELGGIPVQGRRAVIVGRSLVVGRPLAMMLLQKNATVTVCHSRTENLPSVCREADILIVCAGKAGLADRSFVKEGAAVIDVGINVTPDGRLCGDVRFDEIGDIASCATPVPGGVGAVTTSVLAYHLVRAARRRNP